MTTAEALLAAAVTLMLLATTLAIGFHRQALADDFLDQSEAMRAAIASGSTTNYSIDDPDKWFVQFGGAEARTT